MNKRRNGKRRYISELDGLRGLAVLAVIFYHLGFDWAAGGFLGVCIFFVLSGYLITDLLADEWKQNNRINFKKFWIKRARRLLPAMLAMLILTFIWVLLFKPTIIASFKSDFIAALFYISNWWYIFQDQSYFETLGEPSLLTHFWSLAVEEQFYIIWPILMLLGLRYITKLSLIKIMLITASVSAILMMLLYQPGLDPSRVYYGTDTRAFSLLIGAALAIIWPSGQLARKIPQKLKHILNIAGSIMLSILLVMLWTTNQYEPFLYYGGMVILSIVTAMLIAVLVHPANSIGNLFNLPFLRWVGIRSYAIYLWHYPVIMLTTPAINTNGISFIRVTIQLAIILGLSALSWKFIEGPIRHDGFIKFWKQLSFTRLPSRIPLNKWTVIGGSVLILLTSLQLVTNASTSNASYSEDSLLTEYSESEHINENRESAEKATKEKIEKEQALKQEKEENIPANTENKDKHETKLPKEEKHNATKKEQTHEEEKEAVANENSDKKEVTAIGDSILINVSPFLESYFPSIHIDASIGRQMKQAKNVVKQLKVQDKLGEIVIIGLGTNGAFAKDQLLSVLEMIGDDRQVLLVNTRISRPWEQVVNRTLADTASKQANVTLVDWHGASAGHDNYFASDGVHPNKKGAKVYADIIKKAYDSLDFSSYSQ
ncbi:acyltransferase family protein [Agaribacter marinus]|uniref:Acyltransferase family protein n=1 Tax=Virgibacillus salarius TaxID=447199 RepID=A0A941DUF3_9BACI|nr:acyltransferase family protein [Virgibacillus salarius]MBR7795682.1 acyltransferase family protein [Virgibacillus salarius]NAZ08395.1 acyltransferase family protein [Agaribacter marinus]